MRMILTICAVVLVAFAMIALITLSTQSKPPIVVRYGITPYHDTVLPVVAKGLGWYKEDGIQIDLVPTPWDDVATDLADGSIDVSVVDINSFLSSYPNPAESEKAPIFYCPFFVFEGRAIMVHGESELGPLLGEKGEPKADEAKRVAEIARRLRGKKIGFPKGTDLERMVHAALKVAGLNPEKDVELVPASPRDSLAAFMEGDLDAFAAGPSERIEARLKSDAAELPLPANLMTPVIDGLVTTERFAKKNQEALDKLVRIWFRTVRFVESDFENHTRYILQYLDKSDGTRYSAPEYKIAWSFDVFLRDPSSANDVFNEKTSPFFWRTAWDAGNESLPASRRITDPVPHSAYWGEEVLRRVLIHRVTRKSVFPAAPSCALHLEGHGAQTARFAGPAHPG